MKILNKKNICLFSVLALLITAFPNVNKVQAIEVDPPLKSEITIPVATEVKDIENSIKSEEILTKDEYCKRLAKYENITLEQAKEIVNNRELAPLTPQSKSSKEALSDSSTIQPLSGSWVTYKQVYWTENLANTGGARCEVTMGCLATIEGYYSFRFVKAVEGEYVLPSGSGSFKWAGGNQAAKVINNGNGLEFTCAGSVEGEVSITLEAGFELAGFVAGASSSQTVTIRKFYTRNKFYYVY